ncbi:J domain-containing protein [Halomonas vilamensis]|uniref:J domain-containing protein n=1 Tax=Vreelandella vilamensis TaxID=531309 RepID=A0ABU1H466_9GAMM|nr:J domain-containing protein [Halomonas vilamensis]MDR5899096.1 J domain-containing protein [Halomonas vilamensis]
MSIARFSPFELVLLQSRSQVDTATLLLLAWVLVNRQPITDGQRRRRLAQVTAQFRHGHELNPVMDIAQQQDLQAIQLASEVLRKECTQERSLSIMHQAITLATDDGTLSLANHYILRFLADLLGVTPETLSTLFKELTGETLKAPEDISTEAYWQRHDPQYYERKAQEAAEKEQAQARAAEAERQQQAQREEREQEKQRRRQEREEQTRAKRERAQQEKARQRQQKQQDSQQRQRDNHRHQQQHEQRHQHDKPHTHTPPDRTSRALAVLGLTQGANRNDIRRAYRRMAQLHHPDRFFSESEQQVALASARFQRIKNAYDYLMQTYG